MEIAAEILKSQFKTLYGYDLQSWQVEATWAFLYTNKDIVIKTPRGGRKSTWMDLMATHYLLHNPNKFAIIATVGIDLAKEHIDKIRSFMLKSPFASYISTPNNETEIQLINGSRVLAIPQSERTRVGYHPNVKFIDEVSRIDDTFYNSVLMPMGRGLNPPSRNINVSTPNGLNNVFADLWFKTDPQYVYKIDAKIADCFWISSEELERERRILPNLLYRQECLGEFITSAGLPFAGIDKVVVSEEPKIDYSHNFVFGIDLARKHDYTVILVVDLDDNNKVVYMERNQAQWQTQVSLIADLCNRFQPSEVIVDATGLGDVLTEYMTNEGITNITPFIFTGKTKSELINNLIFMIENKSVVIPDKFTQLIYELKWWEWDRKDLVDDCVMALALACWSARRGQGEAKVFDASLYERAFNL